MFCIEDYGEKGRRKSVKVRFCLKSKVIFLVFIIWCMGWGFLEIGKRNFGSELGKVGEENGFFFLGLDVKGFVCLVFFF